MESFELMVIRLKNFIILVSLNLKIFDNGKFFYVMEMYDLELKLSILSIRMFDDLNCCTRVEHGR